MSSQLYYTHTQSTLHFPLFLFFSLISPVHYITSAHSPIYIDTEAICTGISFDTRVYRIVHTWQYAALCQGVCTYTTHNKYRYSYIVTKTSLQQYAQSCYMALWTVIS